MGIILAVWVVVNVVGHSKPHKEEVAIEWVGNNVSALTWATKEKCSSQAG